MRRNTQSKEFKVNVYGIVKIKRYTVHNVNVEDETWSYRPFYIEENELIISSMLIDVHATMGDYLVIDGKEHKIDKKQVDVDKKEVNYTVNTVLRIGTDNFSEKSKEAAGIRAKEVMNRMKLEREEYRKSNPVTEKKKMKSFFFRKIFW